MARPLQGGEPWKRYDAMISNKRRNPATIQSLPTLAGVDTADVRHGREHAHFTNNTLMPAAISFLLSVCGATLSRNPSGRDTPVNAMAEDADERALPKAANGIKAVQ
jgi:hypothetical protein